MQITPMGSWESATIWTHTIVAVFSVVSTCFSGYLAYRVSEAKLDRELKYRELELQLHHAEKRIVEITTERMTHNDRPT